MDSEIFHHNKQAHEKLLSSHHLLLEACSPLFFSTKFKTLNRGRFLLDHNQACTKFVLLFSHMELAEWIIYDVMQNGNELNKAARNAPEGEYSYYFPSLTQTDNVLQLFKEKFRLCNGIIVYKRFKEYIDFWEFHMDISDACVYSVSNNFLRELQKWVEYFETAFGVHNVIDGPVKYYDRIHDYNYSPQQILQESHFSSNFSVTGGPLSLKLSETEWKCFQWVGRGRTMKEIGLELRISPRTVETHLNSIKRKTGLAFKSDLAKLYQKTVECNEV